MQPLVLVAPHDSRNDVRRSLTQRAENGIDKFLARVDTTDTHIQYVDCVRSGYIGNLYSSECGFDAKKCGDLDGSSWATSRRSRRAASRRVYIIAAILEAPVNERILTHLGLKARAPPRLPRVGRRCCKRRMAQFRRGRSAPSAMLSSKLVKGATLKIYRG